MNNQQSSTLDQSQISLSTQAAAGPSTEILDSSTNAVSGKTIGTLVSENASRLHASNLINHKSLKEAPPLVNKEQPPAKEVSPKVEAIATAPFRFVISIDIGTVQSAVVVHLQEPGELNTIH